MAQTIKTQVVVIGSGPGGYSAAFRAADLGMEVVLVERFSTIGGVCLNVGCIPSKAYLHMAKVIDEAADMKAHGITFSEPKIDLEKVVDFKNSVVNKLTSGLGAMAKGRKVQILTGKGSFSDSNTLEVLDDKGEATKVSFEHAIIAVGSTPVSLPFIPEDPRIFDSTGALDFNADLAKRLLVIGGGIIGLEMGTVYSRFGSDVEVVEFLPQIMNGADKDLVKPLQKRLKKQFSNIMLETKVVKVEALKEGIKVHFEGKNAPAEPQMYDAVLVAVGRRPNGDQIAAEKAGVKVDERGFIAVDDQMRTNVGHIYAIGDVIGQPMLAHKSSAEGRLAAEVISGLNHYFQAKCIPSVAYTDPEVAWVGLTEIEAKEQGADYGVGVFPWAANGRSLATGREEGLTKLLFDNKTKRIIGAGITGPHAGDLIGEAALAIEMGCDVEDIALTIHAHPTLGETVMMAAEVFEGTVTDLFIPKKKA